MSYRGCFFILADLHKSIGHCYHTVHHVGRIACGVLTTCFRSALTIVQHTQKVGHPQSAWVSPQFRSGPETPMIKDRSHTKNTKPGGQREVGAVKGTCLGFLVASRIPIIPAILIALWTQKECRGNMEIGPRWGLPTLPSPCSELRFFLFFVICKVLSHMIMINRFRRSARNLFDCYCSDCHPEEFVKLNLRIYNANEYEIL